MKNPFTHFVIIIICICTGCFAACSSGKPEIKQDAKAAVADTTAAVESHQPVSIPPVEPADQLFTDQTLAQVNQLAISYHNNNRSLNWTSFTIAAKLASEQKTAEAIKMLQQVADDERNESRMRLWAWSALRELGVKPAKTEVLGFVLESPMGNKTEYLAVYSDKTVRNVTGSNQLHVWTSHHPALDSAITVLLSDAGKMVKKYTLVHERSKAVPEYMRCTILTTNGIYQADRTNASIMGKNSPLAKLLGDALGVTGVLMRFTPDE